MLLLLFCKLSFLALFWGFFIKFDFSKEGLWVLLGGNRRLFQIRYFLKLFVICFLEFKKRLLCCLEFFRLIIIVEVVLSCHVLIQPLIIGNGVLLFRSLNFCKTTEWLYGARFSRKSLWPVFSLLKIRLLELVFKFKIILIIWLLTL